MFPTPACQESKQMKDQPVLAPKPPMPPPQVPAPSTPAVPLPAQPPAERQRVPEPKNLPLGVPEAQKPPPEVPEAKNPPLDGPPSAYPAHGHANTPAEVQVGQEEANQPGGPGDVVAKEEKDGEGHEDDFGEQPPGFETREAPDKANGDTVQGVPAAFVRERSPDTVHSDKTIDISQDEKQKKRQDMMFVFPLLSVFC